jgi:hypothetical protein
VTDDEKRLLMRVGQATNKIAMNVIIPPGTFAIGIATSIIVPPGLFLLALVLSR